MFAQFVANIARRQAVAILRAMIAITDRSAPPIPRRFRVLMRIHWFVAVLPLRLSTVLRLSGSDKERKWGHHYGAPYHEALRRFKYRRCTLLEIGIGGYEGSAGGESLAAWRSWFLRARVIGCDILDKRLIAGRGIQVHVTDQNNADELDALATAEGPFDIIIDDGSHLNAHQISTFQRLFPALNDGGVYIVEDVQTSYWAEYGGAGLADDSIGGSCMGFFAELAHYVNYPEFDSLDDVDPIKLELGRQIGSITFHHNLVILAKDNTPRTSNFPFGARPEVSEQRPSADRSSLCSSIAR